MATEPEFNPEWATTDTIFPDGTPNKIRPDPAIRTNGYAPDQYPTAQELNWQLNNMYEQVLYLKSQVATPSEKVVGELVFITDDNRNPEIIYGYGTWESFGGGQVIIGAGTHTDSRSETRSFVDGEEGGSYRHQLTTSEIPRHAHTNGISGIGGGSEYKIEGYSSRAPENDNYKVDNTGSVGGDQPHNNMQPYVTCYIWKRVS
jgi:hypothetical protein